MVTIKCTKTSHHSETTSEFILIFCTLRFTIILDNIYIFIAYYWFNWFNIWGLTVAAWLTVIQIKPDQTRRNVVFIWKKNQVSYLIKLRPVITQYHTIPYNTNIHIYAIYGIQHALIFGGDIDNCMQSIIQWTFAQLKSSELYVEYSHVWDQIVEE